MMLRLFEGNSRAAFTRINTGYHYRTQRESLTHTFEGVFLSVNPKTDFRSKNGFRVPFGKSKSGFLIW